MIRQIQASEREESLRLMEFAFQWDSGSEQRQMCDSLDSFDRQWGYYLDGRLASRLTLLPLQVYVQGIPMRMGGIEAVATWPEYRRTGMVAALLRHSLSVMRQSGQTFSFLHPFDYAFYAKYGWTPLSDYKKYEIAKNKLPSFSHAEGHWVETADWSMLQPVYEAYARQFNGMLVRSEEWWERRVMAKRGRTMIYRDASGAAAGYIRYMVTGRVMQIQELVHLDERARKAIWQFIAKHDSMIDKVTVKAPIADDLPHQWDDPRIKQEIVPFFMARIVDASEFLRQYRFAKADRPHRFALHVTDEHAAWNARTFDVHISPNGEATVHTDVTATDEAGLHCDIRTLTAMMIGSRRPSWLEGVGRLSAPSTVIAEWETRLPMRTVYFMDSF